MGYREPAGQRMSMADITPGVVHTVAPTSSCAEAPAALAPVVQQQLAWQAHLLSAMGIERWVSQSSPVISIDKALWDMPLAASHVPAQFAPTAEHEPLNTVTQTGRVIDSAIDSVIDDQPAAGEPLGVQAFIKTPVVAHPPPMGVTQAQQGRSASLDTGSLIVPRFGLQAIRVFDWVLVVDSQALHQEIRYQQLWQQITTNLRQTPAYFDFPLCDNETNMPTAILQTMASHKMAWASLQGFLYGLTHERTPPGSKQMKPEAMAPRLGALTALPDCLEALTFERLPYLNEMVEDYRLKRQLWRLLTQG